MCGLVGVIGDITPKSEKVFKDLLFLDVVRGPHSTGIVNIMPTGVQMNAKIAGSPHDLLKTDLAKKVLSYQSVGLMGHNRWATVGDVTTVNAHPFKHGAITGMHNGTLTAWKYILEDANDFEVDSDCLIHNINTMGIKWVAENVDGAFALTWYDEDAHTFNMLRNEERPLFFAYSKDKRQMVYASEEWMIEVACMRHGLKMQDEIHDLKIGKHLSFSLPDKARQPVEKPKAKKLDLFEAPVQSGFFTGGNRNTANGNRWDDKDPEHQRLCDIRDDMIADFEHLKGTTVPFFITGIDEPQYKSGLWYVEAEMSYWPSYRIRFGVGSMEEAVSWLDMGDVEFEGRVNWSVQPYVNRTSKGSRLEGGWLVTAACDVDFASEKPDVKVVTHDNVVALLSNETHQTGPDGCPISKEDWDKLTKEGCANCSTNLFYDKDQRVHWLHDHRPICGDCHDEITEEIKASNN